MSCHTFPTTSLLKTLRKLLPPRERIVLLDVTTWPGHLAPAPPGLPLSVCPFPSSTAGPRDGLWFKSPRWPHVAYLNSVCHLPLSLHTWSGPIFPETKDRGNDLDLVASHLFAQAFYLPACVHLLPLFPPPEIPGLLSPPLATVQQLPLQPS